LVKKPCVFSRNRILDIGRFQIESKQNKILVPAEVSPDLCEFVGAIIGNGNLWTDGIRFRVELTGNPELDVQYFCYLSQIAELLFKKKPYLMRVRQRGLRWRLQSRDAYLLLTELGLPAGRGNLTSPKYPTQ
jgi:hypothetical protein